MKTTPRTEFTRQMVHKLERSAGTKEYARELSALLDETLEPPNFKLNPPPAEDSIPDGKQNPSGYPLWYKEPHKMPYTASEAYQLLREKYANSRTKDIFDEESEDFSDEIIEDDESTRDSDELINTVNESKLESESTSSNWSTSVTETTRNSDSRESGNEDSFSDSSTENAKPVENVINAR